MVKPFAPDPTGDAVVDSLIAELEQGRHLVPSHLWSGIVGHVVDGQPTGNFLARLFDNDLRNAVAGGDDTSIFRIRDLVMFMHNFAPSRCWGSPEVARRWREAGGLRGGAHKLTEESA